VSSEPHIVLEAPNVIKTKTLLKLDEGLFVRFSFFILFYFFNVRLFEKLRIESLTTGPIGAGRYVLRKEKLVSQTVLKAQLYNAA